MLSLLTAASEPIYWSDLGLVPGIELGFFTLRFYSLAYLLGILVGYWHLGRMVKAPGAPMAQSHVDDLLLYCTLGIIIGGRLGYALFYTGGESAQPSLFTSFTPTETISWDLLRLWDGGMSFHGGGIGLVAAVLWVSWRNKLSFIRVCDYLAVNVPFGMFLGRVANFINGELWGRTTDVPWAIVFPGGEPLPRHPSQLYEAIFEGALLCLLMLYLFWRTRARFRPGLLLGVFTTVIATARFIIEFYREPDAQLAEFSMDTGLSMGQWLTIPLIVLGIVLIVIAMIRPPLATGQAATAKNSARDAKPDEEQGRASDSDAAASNP